MVQNKSWEKHSTASFFASTLIVTFLELESTLLVADDPEAKHVDAPGLHLLHVPLKLGGERDSQKAGFKLGLFGTETGISMVTGWSCCSLIGWSKSWSGSVQTPPGPTRH